MKRLMQTSLMAGFLSISVVWAAAGLVQSKEGFRLQHVVDVDAPGGGAAPEGRSGAARLIREEVKRPQRPQGRQLHEAVEAPTPSVAPGGGADTESLSNGGMGGSGRTTEP